MGGSLTEEELSYILSCFPGFPRKCFIETGTYKGYTTRLAARNFDLVHTIEIVKALSDEAQRIGDSEDLINIVYHVGDSLVILPEIVKRLPVEAVFMIDSHISGPDTSHNGILVPLLEELDIILKNYNKRSIFIIDDVRLFSKYSDWKGISYDTILDKFKDREIELCFENNDRFIIGVKAK